jgi:hypothetical protein
MGQSALKWHMVTVSGARRENSAAERLLQNFEQMLAEAPERRRVEFPGLPDRDLMLEVVAPVLEVQFRDAVTNRKVKRKVRWPVEGFIWIRCILTKHMFDLLCQTRGVKQLVPDRGAQHEGAVWDVLSLSQEAGAPSERHPFQQQVPELLQELQTQGPVELGDPEVFGSFEDQLTRKFLPETRVSPAPGRATPQPKAGAGAGMGGPPSGVSAYRQKTLAGTTPEGFGETSVDSTSEFFGLNMPADPRVRKKSFREQKDEEITQQLYGGPIELPEHSGCAKFVVSYLQLLNGKTAAAIYNKYGGSTSKELDDLFFIPRDPPQRTTRQEGKKPFGGSRDKRPGERPGSGGARTWDGDEGDWWKSTAAGASGEGADDFSDWDDFDLGDFSTESPQGGAASSRAGDAKPVADPEKSGDAAGSVDDEWLDGLWEDDTGSGATTSPSSEEQFSDAASFSDFESEFLPDLGPGEASPAEPSPPPRTAAAAGGLWGDERGGIADGAFPSAEPAGGPSAPPGPPIDDLWDDLLPPEDDDRDSDATA